MASIFEKGLAWVKSGTPASEEPSDSQSWLQIEGDINNWKKNLDEMIVKLEAMIGLKEREMGWDGPDTEIDAIQEFKAKIMSGRQYNGQYIADIRKRVLVAMRKQARRVEQISDQLSDLHRIKSAMAAAKRAGPENPKFKKLERKKQIF